MYKKVIVIIVLILSIFVFLPEKTYAKENNLVLNSIYILDEENDLDGMFDNYNQQQNCDGENSILGNVNDDKSVAWLLQQVLNFVKVVGPILVVILSSIDFIKVIVNSDDEAMRKAFTKLWQRLVLAALLFFVPIIVEALLDVFGFTSNSTCGLS